MFTEFLVLIILIVLNAFFAASEIALISLNDNGIRLKAEEGNKKAIQIKKLLDEPSRFLATIQIGITLAGFLIVLLLLTVLPARLVTLIKRTGVQVPEVWLKNISVILITIILSYFTLLF